jgi:diacylglycerol kinase family enzyme
MKVTLIHNEDAGDDRNPTPGQLEALIREAGHDVRLQSCKQKGWGRALKRNADLIAVAGGDGTVGRVARRLVGKGVPLAVLPMGTANNIAKSIGVAGMQATQLIPGWASAKRQNFDAGVATGPWGTRSFVESVGLGLLTQAIPWAKRSKTMETLEGEAKVAYALQLMREHLNGTVPLKVTASLDGEDISGEYLMFEAMNTSYIGPNLFLAPDLQHGEGLLHIVAVRSKDREILGSYLANWQDGKMWPSELGVPTGERLELEWTGYPLHIDDKLWPDKGEDPPPQPATISLSIARAALEILVPAPAKKT